MADSPSVPSSLSPPPPAHPSKDKTTNTSQESPTTNTTTSSPSVTALTSCACTQISIRQLFYEMKQKFATVPDDIVTKYVKTNCHNRDSCIDALKKESVTYPGSVQAYPQALRQNSCSKKGGVGGATAAATAAIMPNQSLSCSSSVSTSTSSLTSALVNNGNGSSTNSPTIEMKTLTDNENKLNKIDESRDTHTSDNKKITNSNPHNEQFETKPKVPQRPNTLNITNYNRPTRTAPPPPTAAAQTPPTPQQISIHHIQTPTEPTTDSLNVSLNVTVSPVAPVGRPPVRPPRHTSALSVHPEPAFSRFDGNNDSPRSYTSVNFTLRQPANNKPQSPIEISTGPSLKYSSSSYDARMGYQSRLEITVGGSGSGGGGGGTVSASRTRPRSCYNPVIASNSNSSEFTAAQTNMRAGVSMPNVTNNFNSITANIVHRQILCKQRLSKALETDKKRLELMQRELRVLKEPLQIEGVHRLDYEIERLQFNCNQMVQEVEEAGPSYRLGETNEAFYKNIYTAQRLSIQQQQQNYQHHRPPPRPPTPNNYNVRSLTAADANESHQYEQLSQSLARTQILDETTTQNQDGEQQTPWTCNMCTFQNHPLLNKCEQCDMPLLTTTTSSGMLNRVNSAPQQPPVTQLQFLTSLQENRLLLHQQSLQKSAPPTVLHNPFQYVDTNDNNASTSAAVAASPTVTRRPLSGHALFLT